MEGPSAAQQPRHSAISSITIRWQWCGPDGRYVSFNDDECRQIEEAWSKQELFLVLGSQQGLIDLQTMQQRLEHGDGGEGSSRRVRRWDMAQMNWLPESWHYPHAGGHQIAVFEVDKHTADYKLVEEALFRYATGSVTRATHRIASVRRIQNIARLRCYSAERESMLQRRGPERLGERLLLHGSRAHEPLAIAAMEEGFMCEYANPRSLFGQGCYFAHAARYSHAYAYRSDDLMGKVGSKTGRYHHLLVCRVLCGLSKVEAAPWLKQRHLRGTAAAKDKLELGRLNLVVGEKVAFDSVAAGPFQPHKSIAGPDASTMFVVYNSNQAVAEFAVTYEEQHQPGLLC